MTPLHWPLSRLRLRTPALELRWPTMEDLDALARLAEAGVHDPGVQPFEVPWTDASPAERARSTMQYHWARWGSWRPADWSLDLVVDRDGTVVGTQGLAGRDFTVRRQVGTGSWVGQKYQGQGIGTEMRAAVLHLAFEGLHAGVATSCAHDDNPASLAVSRKLGYVDNGIDWHVVRGQSTLVRRLRLDRSAWEAHRSIPVEINGLTECLADFGLTP
ncbi:MAG: GNAT family N-acetyltransferase [Streptosporangiaceae bacterium]